MKVLHLSDLHIGGEINLQEEDSACTNRCEIIFNNIIANCKPASEFAVVITGDVTDGGSAVFSRGIQHQYEEAARLIGLLRNKGFIVLPVPGNHDYGYMGTHPKKKYGLFFREKLLANYQGAFPVLGHAQAQGLINDVAFIGLDSMADAISRDYYWGAQGKIGDKQLQRLQKILDSEEVKKASARVVYLHHHLFDPKDNMELHDAENLKQVLAGKNVDVLLFGHNHNGWKWNGWWNIAKCYDAGTSTRKEGAAGYHRILEVGGDNSRDYDGDFFGNLEKFTGMA